MKTQFWSCIMHHACIIMHHAWQNWVFILQQSYGYLWRAEKMSKNIFKKYLGFKVMETTLDFTSSIDLGWQLFWQHLFLVNLRILKTYHVQKFEKMSLSKKVFISRSSCEFQGQILNFILQQSYGYQWKPEKVFFWNLSRFFRFKVMEMTFQGQNWNFILQQSYGYHWKPEKVLFGNLLKFLGFKVMETNLLLTSSI